MPERKRPGIAVGLARASIYGTYRTDKRLVDDVDVRVLVVRGGGGTAALAVADLCYLWPATCLRVRDKLAGALGVPRERVGIFTTQNHSAEFDPGDDRRLDAEKLDGAFLDCAREAAAQARPVEIARVAARPATGLTICRRLPLEGFGKFTVYYGYRLEDGRADASHVIKKALASLSQGLPLQVRAHQVRTGAPGDFAVPPAPLPVPEPLWARPAEDDLVQALFFRALDGTPVGSVVRLASHPIAANHLDMDWQSGDYPAYARRRLEAEFGGRSLFLTGPCGNQCPPVGRKSLELARELGEQVAGTALAGLAGARWERGGPVAAVSPEVELRVRGDYPASAGAAKEEMAAVEARIKELAAAGGPLPEIKRLSDRCEVLAYAAGGLLYDWSGIRAEGLPGGVFRHPLFAMRIGPSVIAGLPGEPFGAYSARLRAETIGDDLIVAEEANGWISYLPTAAEWPLGGYEPNADFFEAGSEQVLIGAAGEAVRALMKSAAKES